MSTDSKPVLRSCKQMDDTNISVEEAKQIGETNVLPSVQKWIEEAEGTIADATTVIQGEGRCFKWPFPNLCKRYKLSRKAKKLEGDVSNAVSEAKFEKFCYRPRPEMSLPPSARDYEAMWSRTSMLDAVKEALKNPDICMVGVYGMGGVGKTTLAKELAWQAEKEGLFATVVMATITSAPNMRGIQGQLADGLGLKLASESEEGRAAELRKRILTEKSILVILDDLWSELDLTQVGVPYGDQHKGCKLVLTGRDRNVLHRMGTQTDFPLGVLSQGESWSLFESMAGDVVRHSRVEAIAVKVLKCCSGLPLLIVTVAKALRKKEDVRIWKNALTRLEVFNSEDFHKTVFERLKFSYECLESEELRSLFLLIGSFENGFNNDDGSLNAEDLVLSCWALGLYKNVRSLEEARNRHYTLVKELMDSSLLLDSEINSVRMHDLVRDMAKSIASTTCPTYVVETFTDTNEWPNKDQLQKIHHIILPEYRIKELPENMECPNLKLFFLQFCWFPNLSVRDNFFSRMPELKVLHLNIGYPNFMDLLFLHLLGNWKTFDR
ncbi:hypothetical protein PIB30_000091 [Stylosanthes scabra]|uniref:AAA+ ATPase domain-containing protein n=1 Tax=Stylosanthes scabra TaxID=79078 RepID=A0ABU6R2U4_9FABA|nr:hypothetical protein [Stylosanthes scabra]